MPIHAEDRIAQAIIELCNALGVSLDDETIATLVRALERVARAVPAGARVGDVLNEDALRQMMQDKGN